MKGVTPGGFFLSKGQSGASHGPWGARFRQGIQHGRGDAVSMEAIAEAPLTQDDRIFRVLAVSGSLRAMSSNTRVLQALRLLAPPGLEVILQPPLDGLPFFNPDVEAVALPPAVQAWRAAIGEAGAVIISSPEYAHGVSGVLKNSLDWLVGGVELADKPIAILNTRPEASLAHAALVETLRIMGGRVVDQTPVPLTGRGLDAAGIAMDPGLAALLGGVLASLQQAERKSRA